ncbi:hypothetical protein [Burkholderia pyrrocinia]
MLRRAVTALLLLQAAHAWAGGPNINIGSLYDYMPGNTSSITKPIRNSGDETGFVRIDVKRIVYDANGKASEMDQPDNGSLQDRLIVSPNRLIAPAEGVRSTRILYVGKRDEEQYFRVRYLPVQPSRKDGFDVTADVEHKFASAGVKVLIGYGEIVFVRPTHEKYDTVLDKRADGLTVSNNGNSTIILDNYEACHQGEQKCAEPMKKFLLPHRKLDISGKDLTSVSFDLEEGTQTRNQHFDFSAHGR